MEIYQVLPPNRIQVWKLIYHRWAYTLQSSWAALTHRGKLFALSSTVRLGTKWTTADHVSMSKHRAERHNLELPHIYELQVRMRPLHLWLRPWSCSLVNFCVIAFNLPLQWKHMRDILEFFEGSNKMILHTGDWFDRAIIFNHQWHTKRSARERRVKLCSKRRWSVTSSMAHHSTALGMNFFFQNPITTPYHV